MNVQVVIGACAGDESKGRIVAKLAKNSVKPLVILTNGGAQRAHSIIKDGRTYTYKHFGSGTHFGADNYYSPMFILNPMQFVLELSDNDIPVDTINWRHKDCRWSTPYDMIINQLKEQARARVDKKHGSCGMGIWETVCRYNDPNGPKISFDEFHDLSYKEAENFLKKVRTYYEKAFKDCGPLPDIAQAWYSSGLITAFMHDCGIMYDRTVRSPSLEHTFPFYTNIIFENGQGLLLTDPGYDKKGTTPSNTGLDDIISMLKQYDTNVIQNIDVHYVTRPYLTRHGNDDTFNEIDRRKISSYIKEDATNVYNVHQGKFKYSDLSIGALSERVEKDFSKLQVYCPTWTNKNKIIELTHCDEMDRLSEFKNSFDIVVPTDSPVVL